MIDLKKKTINIKKNYVTKEKIHLYQLDINRFTFTINSHHTTVFNRKDQAKLIALNNKSTFDSNATLNSTNKELEKSNQRLIKLANNISRQFEEPLQIINESSQKVVEFHKDDLSEEKIEQARRINSSSKRLKTMIQHLFNLSIIDGNVRFDQIPLNEILQ